ncbi:MAG: hypothetical protein IBJ12_00320 [Sphingomonadaceae bacterium]|nr:hypothetical protein [Sphingomonadaceae bacterium]
MRSTVFSAKTLLIALPLFAVAAPAAAQDIIFVPGTGETVADDDAADVAIAHDDTAPVDRDDKFGDLADRFGDPAVQDGVAAVVERATGAMMNMNVGRFAQAIERARPGTVGRRIPSDATVGDLAGRDARYLPEELGERSREAMGMMSGLARAMAVMMPEFERMGREMEESFRTAKAEAKRNRY